jgi:hypothetical protein
MKRHNPGACAGRSHRRFRKYDEASDTYSGQFRR